ncbi:hypothetical protein [Alteriqipengyuania sp. 357]
MIRISLTSALIIVASVSACSENAVPTTTITSNRNFDTDDVVTEDQCLERLKSQTFSSPEEAVDASFTYEITALGDGAIERFWGSNPAKSGKHSVVVVEGASDGFNEQEFLESEPEGDTEVFRTNDMTLFRVNSSQKVSFTQAIGAGCKRLRDGISLRRFTTIQRQN